MNENNKEGIIEHLINLSFLDQLTILIVGFGCVMCTVSFIWLILSILGG